MMATIETMTADNHRFGSLNYYHYPVFASDIFAHSLSPAEKKALKKKNKELAKQGEELVIAASAA